MITIINSNLKKIKQKQTHKTQQNCRLVTGICIGSPLLSIGSLKKIFIDPRTKETKLEL